MKNIEEVRGEIREADRQMAAIFEKRMRAVREIAAYSVHSLRRSHLCRGYTTQVFS